MEEKSNRIQTSILNGVEKKILTWLAAREPSWMTSDTLTFIGFIGAVVIAAGYILSNYSIHWLWLSSLGFVINWYGDSLDGTLARVRHTQRPVYGFYLDHTVDAINEVLMFVGIGLSSLMHLPIAMAALVVYLMLTLNVCVNAHLKGEFKLTYAGFGPTELRIILILVNTLFILIKPLRMWSCSVGLLGWAVTLSALDLVGLTITILLVIVYFITIYKDASWYAKADPPKK